MRKHLVWVLGLALAIGISAVATADNTQKFDASVRPSKAPKTKFVGTTLHVVTLAGADKTGALAVKPATKVNVYFDNDIKFNPKGIATCPVAKIQNLDTKGAIKACPKAIVGKGKATAYVAGDPDPNSQIIPGVKGPLPGVITAFNGPPKGGKPTIILHTRVDATGSTTALTGVLNKTPGDLGNRLDVTVPPLPGFTALGLFDVTVHKVTPVRVGRKTVRTQYVSFKCGDANKTLNFKATFKYDQTNSPTNGVAPNRTLTDKQPCTVAGR